MKQFRFYENEYDFIYFLVDFLTIFILLVWALSHVFLKSKLNLKQKISKTINLILLDTISMKFKFRLRIKFGTGIAQISVNVSNSILQTNAVTTNVFLLSCWIFCI